MIANPTVVRRRGQEIAPPRSGLEIARRLLPNRPIPHPSAASSVDRDQGVASTLTAPRAALGNPHRDRSSRRRHVGARSRRPRHRDREVAPTRTKVTDRAGEISKAPHPGGCPRGHAGSIANPREKTRGPLSKPNPSQSPINAPWERCVRIQILTWAPDWRKLSCNFRGKILRTRTIERL